MQNEQVIDGVTYLVTYVRKEENKQSKRGNGYWYISLVGNIYEDTNSIDEALKPFCYPTEAEATKARDKTLALYRIKSYCDEQWGEFIPDWGNCDQIKNFIIYNNKAKEYRIESNEFVQKLLLFYLAERKHCEEIIEKFKDDLDILFDKKG